MSSIQFKPVKDQGQVTDRIVNQIQAMIAEGDLKPGDKLPSERQFAGILGIGRNSLREALKVLSAKGLVNTTHGKGVFVQNPPEKAQGLEFLSTLPEPNIRTIQEVFIIRELIEGLSAEWAAERIEEEQALLLYKDIGEMEEAVKNDQLGLLKFYEYDCRFHMTLARITQNELIVAFVNNILVFSAESRKTTLMGRHRPYSSINEHKAILKAVAAKDSLGAKEAMLRHLANVRKNVLDNYSNNNIKI